jgi:hypothetical protein
VLAALCSAHRVAKTPNFQAQIRDAVNPTTRLQMKTTSIRIHHTRGRFRNARTPRDLQSATTIATPTTPAISGRYFAHEEKRDGRDVGIQLRDHVLDRLAKPNAATGANWPVLAAR